MRECNRCRQMLPAEQFHSKSAKCKTCKAEIDLGRKRDNPQSKKRNDTDAARARKRRWQSANRDRAKEIAYRSVREYVKRGLLSVAKICAHCGQQAAQRRDGVRGLQAHHHRGYHRPLDVIWLCPPCHRAEHDAARQADVRDAPTYVDGPVDPDGAIKSYGPDRTGANGMKLSTAIAIVALAVCAMIFASVGRQYLAVLETAVTAVPTVEQAYRERTQRLDAAIEESGG